MISRLCGFLILLAAISLADQQVGFGVDSDLKLIPETIFLCDGYDTCYALFETFFTHPGVKYVCYQPLGLNCHLDGYPNKFFRYPAENNNYLYLSFGMDDSFELLENTLSIQTNFTSAFNTQCDNYGELNEMVSWCINELSYADIYVYDIWWR